LSFALGTGYLIKLRSIWNTTNESTGTADAVFESYSYSSTTERVESESAGVCVRVWCANNDDDNNNTSANAVRVLECEWGEWFWGSEEWVCTDVDWSFKYEWVCSDVEWFWGSEECECEWWICTDVDWSIEYSNVERFCGSFQYEWVCSNINRSFEHTDVDCFCGEFEFG